MQERTLAIFLQLVMAQKLLDDDNILLQLEDGETIPPPFRLQGLNSGRTMLLKFIERRYSEIRTPLVLNPYIYMGASHSFSWPRGFPIDKLQNNFAEWSKANSIVEKLGGDMPFSNIGVIQSLCNGDPDNDAVFRMTRHHSTKFSFDKSKSALPLLIPLNMYSPYNAQATTHLYSVFWGLYLPITVSGRVTDIWRSYVTQRLMKELNLYVVYTPPIVTHERSAICDLRMITWLTWLQRFPYTIRLKNYWNFLTIGIQMQRRFL